MNSPKMMIQVAAVLAFVATSMLAEVPATRTKVTPGIINYQGRLLTPSGVAYMDGIYNIEFRLYESSTGSGSGLWARAYPVYVKDGYFNVMLGGPGSMPPGELPLYPGENELWKSIWFDSNNSANANDRYLGLKVTGVPSGAPAVSAEEAFPRQRLLSAPFAERAQMAQYARASYDSFTVGTTLMASGAVTAVSNVTVKGLTTLTNTTVNGTLSLNKGMTVNNAEALFNNGITVSGSTAIVKAGLEVSGAIATFRGGLNVVNSKIQEDGNSLIPRGVIVMWHGSVAPLGWALCDGNGGTPDLRGRFVLGSGQGAGLSNRSWKNTGGEENHQLSWWEMPSHNHDFIVGTVGIDESWNNSAEMTRAPNQPRNNGNQWQGTGSAGMNYPHNTMPPFYVLAYIMKL